MRERCPRTSQQASPAFARLVRRTWGTDFDARQPSLGPNPTGPHSSLPQLSASGLAGLHPGSYVPSRTSAMGKLQPRSATLITTISHGNQAGYGPTTVSNELTVWPTAAGDPLHLHWREPRPWERPTTPTFARRHDNLSRSVFGAGPWPLLLVPCHGPLSLVPVPGPWPCSWSLSLVIVRSEKKSARSLSLFPFAIAFFSPLPLHRCLKS